MVCNNTKPNMDTQFFTVLLSDLTASVICVPIAKKLGLSSILGYLFAGIIIGPLFLD
jgi:CPA2 family monovalent cation:H+ antiporter-2